MKLKKIEFKPIKFIILLGLVVFSIGAINEILQIAAAEDLFTLSAKWRLFQYFVYTIPAIFIFSYFVPDSFFSKFQKKRLFSILLIAAFILIGIGIIVFLFFGAGDYQRFFVGYFTKTFLVLLSIGVIYLAALFALNKSDSIEVFLLTALGIGFVLVLFSVLEQISSTPFSLGWSEGSFLYLASTYFSERIYGVESQLPYIMSTRHILEMIPFLVGDFPIEFHRAWLALLKLSIPILFAFIVVKRFHLKGVWGWIIGLWSILYVFQGVIYYNILLSAVIVLWGFKNDDRKRSILIVILASFFGGMNRINWVFTPPLLGILIYLCEKDLVIADFKRFVAEMLYPSLLFLIGSTAGLLGLFGYYIGIAGYTFESFVLRMGADPLYYRLLPNQTFSLGVILGAMVVTGVQWIFIIKNWVKNDKQSGLIKFIMLLIAVVLFFGGLAVSAKIGGGADLHNMDAYLICIFIFFVYAVFEQNISVILDSKTKQAFFVSALLIPVLWQVTTLSPYELRSAKSEEAKLLELQFELDKIRSQDDRPILYITQRQLITFGQIEVDEMIHDYELVDLFEMVMAGNDSLLSPFIEDLEEQSFAAIITDPQPKEIIYDRIFLEESNKWYEWVTLPLLEAYDLSYSIPLPSSSIEIYTAKNLGVDK